MADINQLLEALRNADAAGDDKAAQRFAELIDDMRRPRPTMPSDTVPGRQEIVKEPPKGGNIFEQAGRFLSGEGRRQEGVGEIAYQSVPIQTPAQLDKPETWFDDFGRSASIGLGFFLDPNERSRAEIIKRNVKTAQFRRDEYGNLQVRYSPTSPWAYINKPGASFEDAQTFASEVGKFAPGGVWANTGKTVAGRAAMAAGAGSATMAASQTAAIPLGGQGPQIADVAIAGAGGAGGQLLGEGIAAGAGAIKRALAPKGPTVTAAAAVDDLAQAAKARGDAASATAVRRDPTSQGYAEADEFGIPITRGQASGDPRARLDEDDMIRGVRTDAAQKTMGRFADRQAEGLEAAGMNIATRGAQPLGETVEDAGVALQNALAQRRAKLEAAADKAYQQAFKAAEAEAVPPNSDLLGRVNKVVDEEVLDVIPTSQQAVAIIKRLQERIAKGEANFAQVERHRQALNRVIETAANSGDKASLYAAQRIKGVLDEWASETVQTQAAKQSLQGSRQVFSELKQLYGQSDVNDIGGRTIERVLDLERTGTQIAESVLGAGSRPPAQALAAVKRIKEIATATTKEGRMAKKPGATKGAKAFANHGDLPVEVQALREAVFRKIMKPLANRNEGGVVPAQTVLTNMKKALDGEGKAIMDELFTPTEIAAMRRYVAVLERIPPPPGANYSGTAPALRRAVDNLTGGLAGRLFGLVEFPLEEIGSRLAARKAITRPSGFSQPSRISGPDSQNAAFAPALAVSGQTRDYGYDLPPGETDYRATSRAPSGQLEAGNIDLASRPVVKNQDGSISTVRSMSFADENGVEILVPMVSDDGRMLSEQQAIELYYRTGKHLGKFRNADDATAYAERLHLAQERMYSR